ncbi:efflux RND transporter periplasmic adaptor subunit [Piscinibacter terrae]|uniref:Efflux RND transporter periplasmic adaptor subunit n=1 Tax=Piscinibacter terrae TaxID=2496871 RepID=A0A3N7HTJ2_9BURK|nr:efflux RND transporter periplasmic adaptor subunit [Albitalea terrae]RQP25638.1 efflux RND transporter periplasmic adaptor subunit [Albitalea terrae]
MKRWIPWTITVVAVLLVGGLAARSMKARQLENAAAAASAKVPLQLELSASDVLAVRPVDLTRTLAVSGGLKAVNTAVVKAKVAAEVKSLSVREGDTVKAGQVIGQLDTTEYDWRLRQAEQTADSAKAQLDIAKRALENNQALVKQGFISSTGLETSISNEAAARANYEAAAAAVALAKKSRADAVLVAPIAGIVSQRLAQPGERMAVDTKIIEVVDLSRIELEAAVAPEDVVEVKVGQAAQLLVDGLREPAAATVARINPSTQSGTRAVMVYLALQSNPALRQGLFAKGQIDLQRSRALAVPTTAVRVDQARPYVLVVDNGRVSQRSVTLGARGNALIDGKVEQVVEITGGLPENATVLRGSVGAVRDGTPVKLGAVVPTPAASRASAV